MSAYFGLVVDLPVLKVHSFWEFSEVQSRYSDIWGNPSHHFENKLLQYDSMGGVAVAVAVAVIVVLVVVVVFAVVVVVF